MKILITGANGQLGSELQDMLASGRAEIGLLPSDYDNVEIKAVDRDSMDLTDFVQLRKMLAYFQPDLIVNCAAFTNVNACETEQETVFCVNSLLPQQLALYAGQAHCKLVQVSTDYVFAGDGTVPYREWDLCQPVSVYGKSKHLGELYVQQNCATAFIVRTAWLYGYVGNNFVKTIIRNVKQGKQLKVVNDQYGNPTHANDLAYHILKLALTDFYGVYHCTNKGTCSWYDFSCAFLQMAEISANIAACTTAEYPTPARRPAYSALDHMALRNTVGDEMRTWQDALKQYIKNGLERGIFE